jgi:hypothetical protein
LCSTLGVAAGDLSSGVATERGEFGSIGVGRSVFFGHDVGGKGGSWWEDEACQMSVCGSRCVG